MEVYHNDNHLTLDDYVFVEEGTYRLSIITSSTNMAENVYNQYVIDGSEDINYQDIIGDLDDLEDINYQDIIDDAKDINYQEVINELNSVEANLENLSIYRADISFDICAPVISNPELISNTDCFEIEYATCNGMEVSMSQGLPDWSKEGEYKILWCCKNDKNVTYTTSFELDKTAPELIFSKEIKNNVLRPPINIKSSEEGSTIQVVRGAEKYEAKELTITENGNYQMTVTDKAGNFNTYDLIVGMPMSKIYGVLVILLVFMLGAGIFIIRNARKHIQVL